MASGITRKRLTLPALVCTVTLIFGAACNDGGGSEPDDDAANQTASDVASDTASDGTSTPDPEPDTAATDTDGSVNDHDTGPGGVNDTDTTSTYDGVCVQTCKMADDCGISPKWACDNGLCNLEICQTDPECVPDPSLFLNQGCATGDCQDGRVCIEHDGSTYCANKPESGSCTEKPSSAYKPVMKPKADGSGDVEVCAVSNAKCTSDHKCEWPQKATALCSPQQCDGDLKCIDRESCSCSSAQQCIDAKDGDNWECVN